MAEKQNLFSKIKSKFSFKNKNIIISLCIVILCVVVIFASNTKKTQTTQTAQTQTQTFDALEFANQVAQTLENTINSIDGISNAKVVVVVNQSPQIEYLTEETNAGKVVVYHKSGSSYEPAIITQFLPKITGVLVVANGVNDLRLKNNLLNAISAVYNVDISCIDILEGK